MACHMIDLFFIFRFRFNRKKRTEKPRTQEQLSVKIKTTKLTKKQPKKKAFKGVNKKDGKLKVPKKVKKTYAKILKG